MLITDFAAAACNKREVEASLKLNRRAFLQAALAAAAGAGVACSRNRNSVAISHASMKPARSLRSAIRSFRPTRIQAPPGLASSITSTANFAGRLRTCSKPIVVELPAVDESSRLLYGKAFADLNAQQQIDVLHRLEERASSRRDLAAVFLVGVFRVCGRSHSCRATTAIRGMEAIAKV